MLRLPVSAVLLEPEQKERGVLVEDRWSISATLWLRPHLCRICPTEQRCVPFARLADCTEVFDINQAPPCFSKPSAMPAKLVAQPICYNEGRVGTVVGAEEGQQEKSVWVLDKCFHLFQGGPSAIGAESVAAFALHFPRGIDDSDDSASSMGSANSEFRVRA